MKELKIMSVVVTYNRKELLLECVEAIVKQTYKIEKIIIIDNNSTDGTYEILESKGYLSNEQILYKKLNENIGGAGGFYEGMKLARELNAEWVWIMDDDTIPKENSLEELIKAIDIVNDKVSFFASSVFSVNDETMNVPLINTDLGNNGYQDWCKYLKDGIVKINQATFVSLLINGEAMKKIGLPCKDYFIWGDDIEYTLRLNKYYGQAYMVGKSQVIHKRKGGQALSLKDEENINRIKNYAYSTRNNYINILEYGGKAKALKYILSCHFNALRIFFSKCKYKYLKIKIMLKGLYIAVFRKYDYKQFKNRLNS